MACERILEACESMVQEDGFEQPKLIDRIACRIKAYNRARKKRSKAKKKNSHLKSDFQQHRYPDITLDEIRSRLSRFQAILGWERDLIIERKYKQLYQISPKGL